MWRKEGRKKKEKNINYYSRKLIHKCRMVEWENTWQPSSQILGSSRNAEDVRWKFEEQNIIPSQYLYKLLITKKCIVSLLWRNLMIILAQRSKLMLQTIEQTNISGLQIWLLRRTQYHFCIIVPARNIQPAETSDKLKLGDSLLPYKYPITGSTTEQNSQLFCGLEATLLLDAPR